jgi:hypothetical protein
MQNALVSGIAENPMNSTAAIVPSAGDLPEIYRQSRSTTMVRKLVRFHDETFPQIFFFT